jgi:hypothetical protein
MGDSNMNKDNELVDLNEVDLDTYIAGKSQNVLNKGRGNPNGKDWTFDDENKTPSVDGDPLFYEPHLPKLPRGTVEDIQNKLRTAGSRLRKDLNKSLKSDSQAWKALRRPASLHSAQRTLADMFFDCPLADQERFRELGDGYVCTPLGTMEKFLYLHCV